MKYAFKGVSKSNFTFFKFHLVLHVPTQIVEYGNIDVCDANRFIY
jgi:hypothetical protein